MLSKIPRLNMKIRDKLLAFLLLFSSPLCHCVEQFQETLLGAVGGGNYSYYWLPQPGSIFLHLRSIKGDPDLYVSCKILKPTYDIDNHEMQSTTCGPESIFVPSACERPVSIAVYGHPSHEVSLYELKVDVRYGGAVDENTYDALHSLDSSDVQHFGQQTPIPNMPAKEDSEYEERSVFWTLFLNVLQVLLDLLVD